MSALSVQGSASLSLMPLQVIGDLCALETVETDIPVPKTSEKRPVNDLAKSVSNWFKKHRKDADILIDFDECSPSTKGYKLLRIKVSSTPETPGGRKAEAVFSANCPASFSLKYDPRNRLCKIDTAFRRGLPAWIKVGDPQTWLSADRGLPSAKVLQILLSKALGINQYNVRKIDLISIGAQTPVDLVHSLVLEGSSLPDAFARCASAQLAEGLGEILGGVQTRFTGVSKFLDCQRLEQFSLSSDEFKAFKNQKKIQEIIERTGFDFRIEDKEYYPIGFWLRFSLIPTISPNDLLTLIRRQLRAGHLDKVSLGNLRMLSPTTEGRIYYHLYKIHARNGLIKQGDADYGRRVFNGDVSLCKNTDSLMRDRIEAVETVLKEKVSQ